MPTPKPCEKCGRDYYPLRRGYCKNCDAHRRQRWGYQSSHVDAEPVRLHVKNLTAAGIGMRRVAEIAGVNRKVIQQLIHGNTTRGTGPTKRVSTKTAEAILAVPIPDVAFHAVADYAVVDATGTRRRLQSLVAYGYTQTYLAGRLGITNSSLGRLLKPDFNVLGATARKTEALYNELEATPGPSNRSRRYGQQRGWKVPMLWDDDIDSPEAAPVDTSDVEAHFLELYEEMRDLGFGHREIFSRIDVGYHDLNDAVGVLTSEGFSAHEIADLIGVSERTVVRRRGNNVRTNSRWVRETA